MWIEAESQICLQFRTICNFMILANFIICVSFSPSHRSSWNREAWAWERKTCFPPDGWLFWGSVRTNFSLSTSLSLPGYGFSEPLHFSWFRPQPLCPLPKPVKIPQGFFMSAVHKKSVCPVLFQIKFLQMHFQSAYISLRCCFHCGHIIDRWYKLTHQWQSVQND